MNIESKQAMRLLDVMVDIRQQLWELAADLQRNPVVTSARDAVTFRRYSERTPEEMRQRWLEYRINAELGNDKGMDGWLGIHWHEDDWMVRGYVRLDHGDGRETFVLTIEDRRATTIDELIRDLQETRTQMIDTIRSVDLEAV